ncbi:beta-1,3-galactosyltransferase 6 [Diachasma alloeum]|uniref:beta-1,3-galactosyltransferase 6 n=1 Tax=Diachasma alloeum TaxID=454923 RepID=UPI00073825E0|nr:beta-1,3-galactosyltransferase 6 [Diachasma alloeum]XP_015108814.1 beta-1,3-galactosyltransferase 6 [Diachasma alloeum]
MLFNSSRVMSKRLNIRVNVATLMLTFVFLTVLYFLLTKDCRRSREPRVDKPKYRLVVVILTSPDGMKVRDAMRKTWLSEETENTRHLFAIGTLDIQPEQRETLQSEQDKFHDLLLLPKLQDSYGTLTKKVLQSMQWVHQEFEFDYLLKSDGDSFVLLHRMLTDLDVWEAKGTRKELYWGFFNGRASVKKTGPWKEIGWNLCDYYLPYAVGGGYVLSYNLVKFIAENADVLRLFNSEDVSVGLWLSPVANIERKHDVRFDTEYISRGCSNQYIVTHKQTPENMKSLHDFYTSTGSLCSKEIRSRMSYHYNWTVPPSQCCNRQVGVI